MNSRLTGLWQHSEFMKLWAGQTVSQFGSTLTREALPLAALLALQATPAQMGMLAAAGTGPILVIGLLAGVWVDRLRRRPILIAADLGRALLLASIPLAAILGILRIEQLYLVAALTGILTMFFDVAYQSFLPSLVTRDQVVEGNSKLGVSASVAEMVSPAVAGGLVQLITAPFTILLDALSFLVSAGSLMLIRAPEPLPASSQGGSVRREVSEGLRAVVHDPLLLGLAGCAATQSFFGGFFGALYGIYVLRELGFSPALLGVVVATGGIGALLGAMAAGPVARRFGMGRTLVGAMLFGGAMGLLIPLARGSGIVAVALMVAAQILGDLAGTIYAINAVSLRQMVTPDRLLGRIGASTQVLVGGTNTAGLLLGGVLGGLFGARIMIAVASAGILLATLWLIFSPVRKYNKPAREMAMVEV